MKIILYTLVPGNEDNPFAQIDPNLLSPEEHQRMARFVFPRDRWSYAAAHALLRLMLAEFHGRSPQDWQFCANEFGRPEIHPNLMTKQPIRFNISHTHGMAVCALSVGSVSEELTLGVDAESFVRDLSPQPLADRFFSPHEAQWLRTLPDEQRSNAFMRLWTLKEAVAKALGRGLQLDLTSFYCEVETLSVTFDNPLFGPSTAWMLHNWNVAPHHCVSLAIRRPADTDIDLSVRHLTGKLSAT